QASNLPEIRLGDKARWLGGGRFRGQVLEHFVPAPIEGHARALRTGSKQSRHRLAQFVQSLAFAQQTAPPSPDLGAPASFFKQASVTTHHVAVVKSKFSPQPKFHFTQLKIKISYATKRRPQALSAKGKNCQAPTRFVDDAQARVRPQCAKEHFSRVHVF